MSFLPHLKPDSLVKSQLKPDIKNNNNNNNNNNNKAYTELTLQEKFWCHCVEQSLDRLLSVKGCLSLSELASPGGSLCVSTDFCCISTHLLADILVLRGRVLDEPPQM